MKLFTGSSWTDLATAAVVCISPAVAWLTFRTTYREKFSEQRRRRLADLDVLHAQLEEIGRWAGNKYDDGSHDPSWYDPSWYVYPFPWEYVERFNRLVMDGEYPGDLTAALVKLEGAARRFHEKLARQLEFLKRSPADTVERLWASGLIVAARTEGSALKSDAISAWPGLTDADREWLRDLYSRNKETHVSGIGKAGDNDGLHEAWRLATTSMEAARGTLRVAQDPRWFWLGNMLARVFVVVGLLFLADFVISLTADVLHRWSTATSVSARPGTTATPAPADTSPTRPVSASTPATGDTESTSAATPVRRDCASRGTPDTSRRIPSKGARASAPETARAGK